MGMVGPRSGRRCPQGPRVALEWLRRAGRAAPGRGAPAARRGYIYPSLAEWPELWGFTFLRSMDRVGIVRAILYLYRVVQVGGVYEA